MGDDLRMDKDIKRTMPRMIREKAGLIPPLLLLLFGAWSGTFAGSASAAGSTVGAAVLLGLAGMAPWRDPLRLGRFGRLLPLALWIVAALSAWRSPVPRASWMALLLLPAFLLLPAAMARCWNRLSSRGITVLVIGVSLWALIDYAVRDLPRVAMPLGQHNLLASWLVILLPLSLSTAREPGIWRWVGLAGGILFSLLYALAGAGFAASFSTDPAVVATTLAYVPWAVLLPVLGVSSYVFDGIYIGATWTRAMLITMAVACGVYAALLFAAADMGNHGLWLAFSLFLVARAAAQAAMLPGLRRRTFA